jgi:hypothetical protein
MLRIRIETKAGKVIERKAEVRDFIDDSGRQYSLAQVGVFLYAVVRRDCLGPIFKVA